MADPTPCPCGIVRIADVAWGTDATQPVGYMGREAITRLLGVLYNPLQSIWDLLTGRPVDLDALCAAPPVKPAEFTIADILDPQAALAKAWAWILYREWFGSCACIACPPTPDPATCAGGITYVLANLVFAFDAPGNCWYYQQDIDYGTWDQWYANGRHNTLVTTIRVNIHKAIIEGQCELFAGDTVLTISQVDGSSAYNLHPCPDTFTICPVDAQAPPPAQLPADPTGGATSPVEAACTDPCLSINNLQKMLTVITNVVTSIERALSIDTMQTTFAGSGQSVTGPLTSYLPRAFRALEQAIKPRDLDATYSGPVTTSTTIATTSSIGVRVDLVSGADAIGHLDTTPPVYIQPAQRPVLGLVLIETTHGYLQPVDVVLPSQTVISTTSDVISITVWPVPGVELDVYLLAIRPTV